LVGVGGFVPSTSFPPGGRGAPEGCRYGEFARCKKCAGPVLQRGRLRRPEPSCAPDPGQPPGPGPVGLRRQGRPTPPGAQGTIDRAAPSFALGGAQASPSISVYNAEVWARPNIVLPQPVSRGEF